MKLRFATVPVLLAWTCQCLPAADVLWTRQPGLGMHISGSAQELPWVIGLNEVVSGNYGIHRFNGTAWVGQPGSGRRLAVDTKGDVWLVNAQNQIFRFRLQTGAWELLSGLAHDIAAGGDGSVWVIGTGPVAGGYGIFRWNGSGWTEIGGGATRIAVERDGSPWVVNDAGNVFRYNTQSRSWEMKRTGGRSVHTGMATGAVWVIETEALAGGYRVKQWNPASGAWEQYGAAGAVAVTESRGVPWIVQADGGIYMATTQVSSGSLGTSTITVAGPMMPPMTPANIVFSPQSGAAGKLLCSAADAGSYYYCGNTKADYVGAYSLDLKCSEGFYDPIYGGSCWKCPADDGNGGWLRSADSVEKDTACWRAPKETLKSANKKRSPAWAWECPSGTFWDPYSPDGLGGSCWECPAAYPRRTANPVNGTQACASPVNETANATLLKFNGCPKPDASTMSLLGKRTPGKPFLDIAAGWSQGVASGGCYACPIIDEAGNFLITARNGNPIYDKTNNEGCRINFKWQPPLFTEPGLSGLRGVKEVIWENRLFEQDRITSFLYLQAESRGLAANSAEAKVWVAGRWQEMAVRPYNSESFRIHVFALLKAALAKEKNVRTAGELMLIKDFENYIMRRRTYLAEQGLSMYDAWKAYSDDARSSRAQSQIEVAMYYGTVPLDFNAMIGSQIAAGGTGAGLVGAMVAGNSFSAGGRAKSLWVLVGQPLKLLQTVQGLTVLSGAAIINVVGAILTTVAIDQFMEIVGARPKLEASLAAAKLTVDLDQLVKETNGEDLLFYYWGKALDTSETEDAQVVSVAAAAHVAAQGKGYAQPN
jgi:hypothetical protein